ncbi:GtrA family protein [Lactiplantibacillus songbeiensis]|jgi:putative flippase GtrA|uniref:GtrA family protein n=1 Tax=Lactiplantibacillus songbeiensis TaxID=2559920 RepID=A0ABW4C3P6_9LACO|nr:GtrA family protein [Lactiplantibacillus songbeiensis]
MEKHGLDPIPKNEVELEAELEAVEKKANNELQLYALWGVITVVFNVALFYLLYHTFGVEYQVANLIDWFFSVLFSFIVNKMFVFQHKTVSLVKEVTTFYGTRVATYVIEAIILWLGISLMGVNGTMTKVIGHGIALVANYFLSKWLVFKKD